jgi:hypothetical protein
MGASDRSIAPAALDQILIEWHTWGSAKAAYRGVLGYPPKAMVCGEFNISRQYDDQHGMLDAYVDNLTMSAVEKQVEQIENPHNIALRIEARNLATRCYVWSSPRLPADPGQRRIIIRAAREILTTKLLTAGIL